MEKRKIVRGIILAVVREAFGGVCAAAEDNILDPFEQSPTALTQPHSISLSKASSHLADSLFELSAINCLKFLAAE